LTFFKAPYQHVTIDPTRGQRLTGPWQTAV
jgi:hypothetical protein